MNLLGAFPRASPRRAAEYICERVRTRCRGTRRSDGGRYMPATQCVHMPTSEASPGASAAHSPTRPQRAHMPTICTTWPQLWQPLLPTHVRFILTTPSLGRTTRLVRLLALRLLIADLEVLGALDRLQADSLARGARQAQGDLLRGLCLWTGRSNTGAAQVSENCPTSSVPACSPDANLLCHHTQRRRRSGNAGSSVPPSALPSAKSPVDHSPSRRYPLPCPCNLRSARRRTFLWKTGFVWPPNPCCLLSYRRFPAQHAPIQADQPAACERMRPSAHPA